MVVNDEMIACYVEGTATEEVQMSVRKYLATHPDEIERVLLLMDKDRNLSVADDRECDSEPFMKNTEILCCSAIPSRRRKSKGKDEGEVEEYNMDKLKKWCGKKLNKKMSKDDVGELNYSISMKENLDSDIMEDSFCCYSINESNFHFLNERGPRKRNDVLSRMDDLLKKIEG